MAIKQLLLSTFFISQHCAKILYIRHVVLNMIVYVYNCLFYFTQIISLLAVCVLVIQDTEVNHSAYVVLVLQLSVIWPT